MEGWDPTKQSMTQFVKKTEEESSGQRKKFVKKEHGIKNNLGFETKKTIADVPG